MIPTNRPVLGVDVDELRKRLGLSVMDACWLFGFSLPKWGTHVRGERKDEPIPDNCCALMVRYLDKYQDSCPIDPAISPSTFYQNLIRYNQQAPEEDRLPDKQVEDYFFLASFLGRDKSAGHRWINNQDKTLPIVDHYTSVIDKDLRQGMITVKDLAELAAVEYLARGKMEAVQVLTYHEG